MRLCARGVAEMIDLIKKSLIKTMIIPEECIPYTRDEVKVVRVATANLPRVMLASPN
jgi:hypothetical protein